MNQAVVPTPLRCAPLRDTPLTFAEKKMHALLPYIFIPTMNLTVLEKEVENLNFSELEAFTHWLDDYAAKRWDDQFEQDVASGKLDELGKKADLAFESGLCTEL